MSDNEMDKWNLGYIKTMFIHRSLFFALNHISSKSRHSGSKSRRLCLKSHYTCSILHHFCFVHNMR